MALLFGVCDRPVGGGREGEFEEPLVLSPVPNDGREEDRSTATAPPSLAIAREVQSDNVGWAPISQAKAILQIPSFVETDAN